MRGRSRCRLPPKSRVARRDAPEEHEGAGDDVRRWRGAHLGCLLVGRPREEMQCDVFVLE